MIAMNEAFGQMIEHAQRRAEISETDCNRLGESLEMILDIARRADFGGEAAAMIEDFIVNHLGED